MGEVTVKSKVAVIIITIFIFNHKRQFHFIYLLFISISQCAQIINVPMDYVCQTQAGAMDWMSVEMEVMRMVVVRLRFC